MLLFTFLIGMIASYVGSITPSMLNITAIKISLESGKKKANWFAAGVSLIVIFQAFFGLFFLKIILENPIILKSIQWVAIVIFAALAVFFYKKSLSEKKQEASRKLNATGFLSGISLSAINVFSIPFFCGVGAVLELYNWLILEGLTIAVFAIGSGLGTFFILYHYILLAEKIKPKIARFTKYINYVLSAVTAIAAIFTLIKLL